MVGCGRVWPPAGFSLVEQRLFEGRHYLIARPNRVPARRALTLRERDAVRAAARGHANKIIASELGVSPSTAGTHLSAAMRKLGRIARVQLPVICPEPPAEGRESRLRIDTFSLRTGDTDLRVLAHDRLHDARLSRAERDVLDLALAGLSNENIALRRGRSVRTVANQIARGIRKLGVQSRFELAAHLTARDGDQTRTRSIFGS